LHPIPTHGARHRGDLFSIALGHKAVRRVAADKVRKPPAIRHRPAAVSTLQPSPPAARWRQRIRAARRTCRCGQSHRCPAWGSAALV